MLYANELVQFKSYPNEWCDELIMAEYDKLLSNKTN
jgi:hypothetical protein